MSLRRRGPLRKPRWDLAASKVRYLSDTRCPWNRGVKDLGERNSASALSFARLRRITLPLSGLCIGSESYLESLFYERGNGTRVGNRVNAFVFFLPFPLDVVVLSIDSLSFNASRVGSFKGQIVTLFSFYSRQSTVYYINTMKKWVCLNSRLTNEQQYYQGASWNSFDIDQLVLYSICY